MSVPPEAPTTRARKPSAHAIFVSSKELFHDDKPQKLRNQWSEAFPLHAAACDRADASRQIAEALRDAGVDEAREDTMGSSTEDIGEILAEYDDHGLMPLHYAAWHGNESGVAALTEQCSRTGNNTILDARTEGDQLATALHFASGMGHLGCVKLLLIAGADPTLANEADHTPLDIATAMSADSDFTNQDGGVSAETWTELRRALAEAAAPRDALRAKAELAHDGIAALQAKVRGSVTRDAMQPILRQRVYPYAVRIHEVNGLSGAHDATGKGGDPNVLCMLTVMGSAPGAARKQVANSLDTSAAGAAARASIELADALPQLFSFRTSTSRKTSSPAWNELFLVPGSNAEAVLVFSVFTSTAPRMGSRRRVFVGQATLPMAGTNVLQAGTEATLPLGPMNPNMVPRDDLGKELPFDIIGSHASGATVRVSLEPYPRGTVECGYLLHQEGTMWNKRWCVLAGRSFDVYDEYPRSNPKISFRVGDNQHFATEAGAITIADGEAASGRCRSGSAAQAAAAAAAPAAVTISSSEVIDPVCMLTVRDDTGSKFHFKTHDRRIAARWIFKTVLASGTTGAGNNADEMFHDMSQTRARAKSTWN